jgi:hypothetical protein|tara:strand:+ start:32 stop:757 length:726 start_codon:yes stop_codon:yes gene_type:complete
MKTTLLQIVQSILNDMDSESVNSLSDTIEAQQIASVVEDTYYNIIAAREIPEHNKLMTLTAMGDSAKPTHFKYPTNTKHIERVEYNVGTAADKDFKVIPFVDPVVFLDRMDEDGLLVETYEGNLDLFVSSSEAPSYYTSFDDEHLIMNAYDSSVDGSLQASKIRAFGSSYPTFSQTDLFEPDLDNTLMPYLLAEAKSTCFSLFKGGPDPKVDQAARRLKSYVQNDQYKTTRPNVKPSYGRK